MNYLIQILCLFLCPKKLDRGTIKATHTKDILLFVATTEAIVGGTILKFTIMRETVNSLPALLATVFVASYIISLISALFLYILNLAVIKRLTYRECLKAILPSRMVTVIYVILNVALRAAGLSMLCYFTRILMGMHQIAMITYYLKKLYFCSRKDLAIIDIIYVAILIFFGGGVP